MSDLGDLVSLHQELSENDHPLPVCSVEEWMLSELECRDRFPDDQHSSFDTVYGLLIAIQGAIMNIKMTAYHDEIAAAYKQFVRTLEEFGRRVGYPNIDEQMLAIKHLGLPVFIKLELDKQGTYVGAKAWNREWISLEKDPERFVEAMTRVWG